MVCGSCLAATCHQRAADRPPPPPAPPQRGCILEVSTTRGVTPFLTCKAKYDHRSISKEVAEQRLAALQACLEDLEL